MYFVDCFCTIKIIDESYPSPGISVNFFAETMDKLPQVLTVGDIVQLSQVVVTNFALIFACSPLGIGSFLLLVLHVMEILNLDTE